MTTETTHCAAACWYATDVECRCSCRGRNHGRGRRLQGSLFEPPSGPLVPPRVGEPPGARFGVPPVQTRLEGVR